MNLKNVLPLFIHTMVLVKSVKNADPSTLNRTTKTNLKSNAYSFDDLNHVDSFRNSVNEKNGTRGGARIRSHAKIGV